MRQVVPGHSSNLPRNADESEVSRRISGLRPFVVIRALLIIALIASITVLTPSAHAEDGIHVVKSGENLSTIAKQYDVVLRDLAANNGISNVDVVRVGQRLVIPGSVAEDLYGHAADLSQYPGGNGYFTVARGSTMSQIAKSHNMSIADLLRLNGLSNPNFLWVGQQLRVTARVAPLPIDEEHQSEPKLADTIYIVQADESLEDIAKAHNATVPALMLANGLPNANFIWVGQRLRINEAPQIKSPGLQPQQAPAGGYRYIEVNLSNQTLTAWQGNVPVMHTYISSGTAATPTVTGRFPIYMKLASQHMSGPGYSLPGVPWVMYFYSGYAIHGTYWHNNFGTPMSHGCVNMTTGDAGMLYNWASEGTEVYVHY